MKCMNCNGTGITSHKRKTRFVNTVYTKCRKCNGTGIIPTELTKG